MRWKGLPISVSQIGMCSSSPPVWTKAESRVEIFEAVTAKGNSNENIEEKNNSYCHVHIGDYHYHSDLRLCATSLVSMEA